MPGAEDRSRPSQTPASFGVRILGAPLRAAGAPLRLAAAIVGEGVRTERAARAALRRATGTLALETLDALLAAAFSEQVVDVVYSRVQVSAVGERVVGRLLAEDVPELIAVRVLESAEFGRMLDRALESEQTQLALTRAL